MTSSGTDRLRTAMVRLDQAQRAHMDVNSEMSEVRKILAQALQQTARLEDEAEGVPPRQLEAAVTETVTFVDRDRPHAQHIKVHRAPGDELVVWLDRYTVRVQLDDDGSPIIRLDVAE